MRWLISITALIGVVLNSRGKWQGFLFWLVSSGYWAIQNLRIGEHEQAVQYAVFWLFALHGIFNWRKKQRKYSEKYALPRCDKCGRPALAR